MPGELGLEITDIGDLVIVRLSRDKNRIRALAHLEKIRRRWAHPELLEVI